MPEWYIVFNSDEYANFMANNKPSNFPYWQSVKEFWSLYSKAKEMSKNYPENSGYDTMIWVIGTSYSAELLLKGFYENTIGRLTELTITGTNKTKEDLLMVESYKEYGDYVHIYPWYEFSFAKQLKNFWMKGDLLSKNMIRNWERKIYFSSEFLFKSGYASLIKLGTKLSYEPEETTIYAVVKDPKNQINEFPKIKIEAQEDEFKLISMPRYDQFRDLIIEMAKKDIQFQEIAGNKKILISAIGEKDSSTLIKSAKFIASSNIVTDKNKQRMLIISDVKSLLESAKQMIDNNIKIEHIFDY